MFKLIFWVSLIMIAYIYVGYPFLIYLLAKIFVSRSRKHKKIVCEEDDYMPIVSILIPAYNEEKVIENKIKNCLSLDYPPNKLEILIASDGSTDKTNEILDDYKDKIIVKIYDKRAGKTNLLNKTVPQLTGDIILFTDASAILEKNVIKTIIKHFKDELIGCVSGKYILLDKKETTRSRGEGTYWRYETFLKKNESDFYSILGAHGALYALREDLFSHLPDKAINDDYILPMLAVKKGYRAIYEEKAIATETAKTSTKGEINRRSRISAGNFQQLFLLKSLLNPFKGKIAFEFISHKFLRSFSFIFFILLLLSNVFLLSNLYLIFLLLQLSLYISALIGYLYSRKGAQIKLFAIPFYIVLINYSSLLGLIKFIKGQQSVCWEKSSK